jgi:hypothetical protein
MPSRSSSAADAAFWNPDRAGAAIEAQAAKKAAANLAGGPSSS